MEEPRACPGCGLNLDPSRPNKKYHGSACRQRAYRLRRVRPRGLDQLIGDQQRDEPKREKDDLRPKHQAQRPQRLGGKPVLPLCELLWSLSGGPDPVADEALRNLSESPAESLQRHAYDAAWEFMAAIAPRWRDPSFRQLPVELTLPRWVERWSTHPDLTQRQRDAFLQYVPKAFLEGWRQQELSALADEVRNLRREINGGLAYAEQRLTDIEDRLLALGAGFPDDSDFARQVDGLLAELRA